VPCILLLLRLYPPVLLTGMRVVQECFQTKKELVGHLIDSAQNNILGHCGATEERRHIVYKQDDWVRINNYQAYSNPGLVELWLLLNKQISIILSKA
ncbi:MAG TPA: hypothetical protein VI385_01970, partial [Flavisolibacter sp.]